ncbi:MAG TPA: hypothetical protein PKG67_07665, partial [Turneriella sp.]|nr:hypothetical protein [Turneriella sp.]
SATDDYSPIIVRLSNNYLALVFASTRSCPQSCSNHNIFVASSVAAYNDMGVLPAFNTPQVITANASPLNNTTRWRLAVQPSGTSIIVYAQSPGGQISSTGSINPVSATYINVGASLNPITEYMCYTNNLLGLDAAGFMIAANAAGTQTYRFNPNSVSGMCPTTGMTNPKLSTGTHISLMRQTTTGIADGYIVSNTAGQVSAQSVTSAGPRLDWLELGLKANGLIATGVSVMQGASESGDLITFSAATAVGGQSDMYVLQSPRPRNLWSRYVAYGTQPVP